VLLASWCAHLSKRFLESAYAVTARLDDFLIDAAFSHRPEFWSLSLGVSRTCHRRSHGVSVIDKGISSIEHFLQREPRMI
jgi:hypothetical protein